MDLKRLSSLLLLCLALCLTLHGCEKKSATVGRYLEKKPLEGLPAGADVVLQIKLRKYYIAEFGKLLRESFPGLEDFPLLRGFESKYGIKPSTDVSSLSVALYNSEVLDKATWTAVLTGTFNESISTEKVKSQALSYREAGYGDRNYSMIDEGARSFVAEFLSGRELIVALNEPLMRQMIELYRGGTNYVLDDRFMSPLLNKVSESATFWYCAKVFDRDREHIGTLLRLLQQNDKEYPLAEIEALILQVHLEPELLLECRLIHKKAAAAELFQQKIEKALTDQLDALEVLKRQPEPQQGLEGYQQLLNSVQYSVEDRTFKLEYQLSLEKWDTLQTIMSGGVAAGAAAPR